MLDKLKRLYNRNGFSINIKTAILCWRRPNGVVIPLFPLLDIRCRFGIKRVPGGARWKIRRESRDEW